MSMQQVIWCPVDIQSEMESLAKGVAAMGGRRALASMDSANLSVVHVHGERHDLWWEFTLEASFKWQAHLHRMRPDRYNRRLHRLTRALALEGLLQREVATLTHETRALADLAVALLPEPEILVWEEPFYLMGQEGAGRAARLVRDLHREGMSLIASAQLLPGLQDLGVAPPAPLHLAR